MAQKNDSGDPASLPAGTRVALVVSSYHREVVGEMARSAEECLASAGVQEILEVEAPGAFELPILAQRLARRPDVDAVLCFGLVLRGETDHDRYIASAVTNGLMRIGLDHQKPVLLGVLTCATMSQAQRRAMRREKGGQDKGRQVAEAAIEVLNGLAAVEARGRETAR